MLLCIVLRRIVKCLLVIVVRGSWYFTFRTLRAIDNLWQICRLWLLVQTHVNLSVDSVQFRSCIRHCVLSTSAVKLSLSFTLHHVIDRNVFVWISFLGLSHSWVIPFKNAIVDSLRWHSLRAHSTLSHNPITRNFHHTSRFRQLFHGVIQVKFAVSERTNSWSARLHHLRGTSITFKSGQWLWTALKAFRHGTHHGEILAARLTVVHQVDLLRAWNSLLKSICVNRTVCHICNDYYLNSLTNFLDSNQLRIHKSWINYNQTFIF